VSAEDQKRRAGEAAAALVQDGTTVGLGTGSTAAWFVKALGARAAAEGLTLRCVGTSRATETLAEQVGLTLTSLDAAGEIDLTVDGADEIGPGLTLIKGGGGALLREKLVWEASKRCVVIADAAKRVATLGAFPLPVELVAFGHQSTVRRLGARLRDFGLSAPPRLRMKNGQAFVSDNGNPIYDIDCGVIDDPARLASALKALTGVVEHGLFLNLASEALIGADDGVERMRA
jgi:ribose 5-phosphate isomerase A